MPSFFQGGIKQVDGVDTGIDSVFDFPTFFSIRDVFANGGAIDTLSKTLAKDRLYPDASSLVTFLGNHDVPRFMHESGTTIDKLKLAFTFLMTARGTPCIYYGDEIAIPGGNDPDNRRDFPGGWKGDTHSAFVSSGRTAQENSIFEQLRSLSPCVQRWSRSRRGRFVDLAIGTNTWAFARESRAGTIIVAINNGTETAEIAIRYESGGSYKSQLGITPDLVVRDGTGTVRIPPHSAEMYMKQ